jgi:hypothetical protein
MQGESERTGIALLAHLRPRGQPGRQTGVTWPEAITLAD